MIELVNQKPHTEEEINEKWPNCYVWLHSYEFNSDNPLLSRGVPFLVIEDKDRGVVKRRLSEYPQYNKHAIISTFPISPGFLSNYALPGENYDTQT